MRSLRLNDYSMNVPSFPQAFASPHHPEHPVARQLPRSDSRGRFVQAREEEQAERRLQCHVRKGCGKKKPDGTFGAPVLTNVVVK